MIKPITNKDIEPYNRQMSKAMLTLTDVSELYGFYKGEILVGWIAVKITKSKYFYKTAYVLEEFRNRGIFSKLLEFLLSKYGDKPIEVNCTPMSFNVFSKNQFKIIKEYKNGCKKLRYESKL